jgi:hypothetical protein
LAWRWLKENGQPKLPILYFAASGGLENLNLRGLEALGALFDLEFYLLTFFKGVVSFAKDRSVMHKDIRTVVAGQETIAFAIIKPLDGANNSICHSFFLFFHTKVIRLRWFLLLGKKNRWPKTVERQLHNTNQFLNSIYSNTQLCKITGAVLTNFA